MEGGVVTILRQFLERRDGITTTVEWGEYVRVDGEDHAHVWSHVYYYYLGNCAVSYPFGRVRSTFIRRHVTVSVRYASHDVCRLT